MNFKYFHNLLRISGQPVYYFSEVFKTHLESLKLHNIGWNHLGSKGAADVKFSWDMSNFLWVFPPSAIFNHHFKKWVKPIQILASP